jgi:predicted PurR-regulated permease PerM
MSNGPALKPWSVSTPVPSASLTSLLFVVVIIGCVYAGREVLVPMALAVLLSFPLAPPVELLQRWHVPRSLSVIGVVVFAFTGVFSLGGLMISQVNQLERPATISVDSPGKNTKLAGRCSRQRYPRTRLRGVTKSQPGNRPS